ncbi:MAG: hypothetical protein NTX29_14815 [Actinobacteria bacterium]|nr:hypothetical protein [Actinomycetota bacterium]
MSVPTASAATGSTVDVLGTVKAIRGTTVVMRWTAIGDRSGRIAPHVPK